MEKHPLKEKIRYQFDNFMARGTGALILGLTFISLVIILAAGLVLALTGLGPEGSEAPGFQESLWQSLMRTIDSGAVAGDTGWPFRLVMLVVTIGGIFVMSTLIGILSNSLAERLENLKRGRSGVVESGHTVILGWNPKIFAIIDQLVLANESRHRPVIVILASKDKTDMDQALQERYGKSCNTRMVCRTGQPSSIIDLEITHPGEARSVIILSSEGSLDPDMDIIRTIMALRRYKARDGREIILTAEMNDHAKLAAARLVAGSNSSFVLAEDSIARITAQACRQRGLSLVYQELLDFDGDELYFAPQPELTGKTFRECLLEYRKVAILGMVGADGVARVNPPMDTILETGAQLIGITQDDSTFRRDPGGRKPSKSAEMASSTGKPVPVSEHFVILAWNERTPVVIRELDAYVPSGSTLTVLSDPLTRPSDLDVLKAGLKHIALRFREGDTTDPVVLESLDLGKIDHLIIMSGLDSRSPEEAEARTMLSLINVRDLAKQKGWKFSITSEILDLTDRELVEAMQIDDFIVSDQLVSQLLAQLAENPGLEPVFADLLDADGSEVYLKPASQIIKTDVETDFYTVTELAANQGAVAVGYKLARYEKDPERSFGIVLNPDKAKSITFEADDRLILIAED